MVFNGCSVWSRCLFSWREREKKQDSCPIVVSGQFEPRLQLLPRAAPTIETAIYWRVADDNAAINLGARLWATTALD